jgi:hypothetical protein
MLKQNECLVAINDSILYGLDLVPSNTTSHTYIAKIINTFQDQYEIILITDALGNYHLTNNNKTSITVSQDIIVSDIPIRDINPKKFYNYADISNELKAKGFINTNVKDKPLENSNQSGFGSGIYGLYTNNPELYKTTLNQSIYEIILNNPFIIQDSEHGDSLTVASTQTNIYIDNLLDTVSNIDNLLLQTNIDNLVRLWNIVFYRTNEKYLITKDWLYDILLEYLNNYINNPIIDNDKDIFILPINLIMNKLEYGGLLADDRINNGWSRGCVSYDFSVANKLETNYSSNIF